MAGIKYMEYRIRIDFHKSAGQGIKFRIIKNNLVHIFNNIILN
jgi:hypothetical protein